jgi:hypothetical protein
MLRLQVTLQPSPLVSFRYEQPCVCWFDRLETYLFVFPRLSAVCSC